MRTDPEFWKKRRVLVTGHTGFKGSWLVARLCNLGAQVHGVSLPDDVAPTPLWTQLGLTSLTETRTDIASSDWIDDAREFSPQIVFHLAAQPLVSEGYRHPALTFRTNVLGTVQLLDAVHDLRAVDAVVIVTTDKVYDVRQPTPFVESNFLGGKDPYSASKACMELVAQSWPDLPFPVVTARAGNVIGGGDQAVNRIVPDLVRAWSAGETLHVRRPTAVRPWQHVIEPLEGYLLYGEAAANGHTSSRALNFGPSPAQSVDVASLVEFAAGEWQRLSGGRVPTWEVESNSSMPETDDLTLDPALARESLGWAGFWGWREAIARTLEWYISVAAGEPPLRLMRQQFADYASR